jgi:hypothetical protein
MHRKGEATATGEQLNAGTDLSKLWGLSYQLDTHNPRPYRGGLTERRRNAETY